jgi:Uma2 family endonuclease
MPPRRPAALPLLRLEAAETGKGVRYTRRHDEPRARAVPSRDAGRSRRTAAHLARRDHRRELYAFPRPGAPHAHDPKGHTAVNPTVLIEVLSPSTEDYDLGEKLSHYKRIAVDDVYRNPLGE